MAEARSDATANVTEDSLGARLRAAREKRRLSLHQAAQDMHVSDDIIAALERNDYKPLGAAIFVHGHLRNYARLLGLPEDQVLAEYEHTSSKLVPPPLMTLKPGGNVLARRVGLQAFSVTVIVVLVVLAVVWWQHRVQAPSASSVEQANITAQTKLPASVSPVAVSLAVTPTLHAGEAKREPASAPAPIAATPYPAARTAKAVTEPQPGVQAMTTISGSAKQAQSPATGVSEPQGPVIHVQFVVTQASWIEVYDATGKRLFYSTAPAGDNLKLSGIGPLQVFLGYSPGVSIELNGVPFNQTSFAQPNNTARFRLGNSVGNGGQAG